MQLDVIRTVLFVDDEELLQTIQGLIKGVVEPLTEDDKEEKYHNTFGMSFEEWNQQFLDNADLKEFVPEYGTTLGEFRQKIWEAEQSEEMPIENLMTYLNQQINELEG